MLRDVLFDMKEFINPSYHFIIKSAHTDFHKITKKSKSKKESSPKYCVKCGRQLNLEWEEDGNGNLFHTKCPPEKPKTYAKSYSVETTHPDQ